MKARHFPYVGRVPKDMARVLEAREKRRKAARKRRERYGRTTANERTTWPTTP